MASTSSPAAKTKKSAATPAVKTAAPKAAKPRSPAKPAAPRQARGTRAGAVSADQRREYIEVAAYYIAERRGFEGGAEMDDWVQAESEIDRLLAESKLSA